jgi:hypothetical protein
MCGQKIIVRWMEETQIQRGELFFYIRLRGTLLDSLQFYKVLLVIVSIVALGIEKSDFHSLNRPGIVRSGSSNRNPGLQLQRLLGVTR